MAKQTSLSFILLACILIIVNANLVCNASTTEDDRKEYIVYMGSLPQGDNYMAAAHHLSLLQEVIPASAKLELLTTRSWDFMGFSDAIVRKSPRNASDIVVGIIDGGIWPEIESFSDEGFGAPPAKWKGVCEGGTNFTCNKKIIGARKYSFDSARDDVGHGTHTASTAAGNIVKDVSFYGLGKGSARGGLPSARIAVYKGCGGVGSPCDSAAILAAFDDAIADGVDIISISIGTSLPFPFHVDTIAIGAFHAMVKGILTVQAAGNSGPTMASTSCVAPWKLGVAASSTDRRFITKLVLGNGKTLTGNSINTFTLNGTGFPIVFGKDAALPDCPDAAAAEACEDGCLDPKLVKGKIVICENPRKSGEAMRAGAVGAIFPTSSPDTSWVFPFPVVTFDTKEFEAVMLYAALTKSANGKILETEAIKDSGAPRAASFSSRGPNGFADDILKPDITAPGIDILAAYSPVSPPSGVSVDKRSTKYNILSGTSMACPHVAGVAAYVKASYPDWSPSAIKSAIMTTAWDMSSTKNPVGEFAYGSGHLNPVNATNPGLVYDASKDDYVNFLCIMGYDAKMLAAIAGERIRCTNGSQKGSPKDMNYPSMSAKVAAPRESFQIVFHRTVTNVGAPASTYKAQVVSSSILLKIEVVPQVLSFKSLNEKKSFNVTVSSKNFTSVMESASLVWSDGKHSVRSPIEYIVYMGSLPEGNNYMAASHQLSLLQEVIPARQGRSGVCFPKYKAGTADDAIMGLHGFRKSPRNASNIVVGMIDSGIWPEIESFSDEGFGAPPAKWKGVCQGGTNFTCNKKIIGARKYSFDSARDDGGHGTHTASTAAGNIVKDVSFYGLGKGSARGGLPSARIAVYKGCGGETCDSAAILSAFDDAIADGVDIISISIGTQLPSPFEKDTIAIGAFHAMAKGILTVQAAGNSGPTMASTACVAPWKLGVAASSTDRRFITKLILGNGNTLTGNSVNTFTLNGTGFPIVYGKDAALPDCPDAAAAEACEDGCLAPNLVKGKIVICEDPKRSGEAMRAGAVGAIFPSSRPDTPRVFPFPVVTFDTKDFEAVKLYAASTKSAKGKILETEAIKDSGAPLIASFSSRGPNGFADDILKPDITAPGIDILAAYSPVSPPSGDSVDKRASKYNIISGTSMACPHVAGVAAYVKASHPDWSPSAIKSAIMTTAWTMNSTKTPEGEFAYGSGHLNPVNATKPGLVYDASKDDYVNFLCSLGYDAQMLAAIAGERIRCTNGSKEGSPKDMNYPSMSAKVSPGTSFRVVFHRTATNVGAPASTYKAQLVSSPRLKIEVVPQLLSFKSLNEKKSFSVTVSSQNLTNVMESASLVWSDGKHSVRSPI
ncbi:hypothetical protein Tsubulata_013756, partial [Turnera subulata]